MLLPVETKLNQLPSDRPLVIGTLLVRDEEEIVQECLDYHLANGVDAFIVTDNGSKDRTREIVAAHPGVIHIIDEPQLNYHQERWVTRMARLCVHPNVRWAVHIDADEFWCGLKALHEEKLRNSSTDVIVVQKEWMHPPVADMIFGTFKCSQMPYFYKTEKPLPKVIHRPSNKARITHGNHTIIGGGKQIRNPPGFSIHHYSVRSYGHFEQKVINGGPALKIHPGPVNHGSRWRKWYAAWLKGELPSIYATKVLTPDKIEQGVRSGQLFSL